MTDATIVPTLGFALLAGVLTFFSPCAYPLLPGYVGFYASQTDGGSTSLGGAVARGLVAGAGSLLTLGGLLVAAFWIGHATMANVVYFEPIVGAILVVLGLLVLFDRAPSFTIALPKRRSSLLGFAIFGGGYALAAAGCVAPLFLGVVARAASGTPATAAAVVGTYVGVVVGLMIAVSVATGMGVLVGAEVLANRRETLRRIAGALMIVAGFGQLYLSIFVLEVL